jgi:hypothetical protein
MRAEMLQDPTSPVAAEIDADEAAYARRLEQLGRHTQHLERLRITAGPFMTRAELIALDVELCRVEATKRMLVPADPYALIPGASWSESASSPAEPDEARFWRDVLDERPETMQRSDQRENRHRPSPTSRLIPR